MNIIILAISDLPEGDATSSRVRLIAKGLREAGNSVAILLIHASVAGSVVENHGVSGEIHGIPFLYASGSTVRPKRVLAILKDTAKGIYKALTFLRHENRCSKVDLVILYTPDLFRYGPIIVLCRVLGVPIFFEACEIMSLSAGPTSYRQMISKFGYRLMENLIPSQAAGVLAISRRVSEYYMLKGMKQDRLFRLPILVDTDNFSPGNGLPISELINAKYFLYSGTFGEKDGVTFILKAFSLLQKKYSDVMLVLTGDSPGSLNRSHCQAAAEAIGLRPSVSFPGYIPQENLIWCYNHALALLVCRSDSAFANTGFPTKLGEYLASGQPVIASGVSDISDYLKDGENALLVPPESPERIYQAMKAVIEESRNAEKIGKAGRMVGIEHFDYRKVGERLDAFLRSTLLEMNL